jgi:AcrR family transcriptional regulator
MPKLIDYAGRFMFFEAACFALVRDHGVHHLSRHRVAKKLGTSISTVRRLLSSEADLRNLALTEIGHRRHRGRYGRPPEEGLEAALWLVRQLIADTPDRIAEELVWWRLNVAAPTRAHLPLDEDHLEEGPLHHRFAVATYGFVPIDVLALHIEPASAPESPEGVVDRVVKARAERDADIADVVAAAILRSQLARPPPAPR